MRELAEVYRNGITHAVQAVPRPLCSPGRIAYPGGKARARTSPVGTHGKCRNNASSAFHGPQQGAAYRITPASCPISGSLRATNRISPQHDSAGFNLATSRQLIFTARSRTRIPRHQLVADSHASWPCIPSDFPHPHPCKQRHSTPEGGVRNKRLHTISPRLPLCSRRLIVASFYVSYTASLSMDNRLRSTLQIPRFRSSDSNTDSLPADLAHGHISRE